MPTETVTSISHDFKDQAEGHAFDEAEGHWVGELKQQYSFVLKYLEMKTTSRGYFVHRFMDKRGAQFIAFDGREKLEVAMSDASPSKELEPMDCFTCKATVTRHSINTFKYGTPNTPYKETVLNRISLGKFLGRK